MWYRYYYQKGKHKVAVTEVRRHRGDICRAAACILFLVRNHLVQRLLASMLRPPPLQLKSIFQYLILMFKN